MQRLTRYFLSDIRNLDDLLNKAKIILKKSCSKASQKETENQEPTQIVDRFDQTLMRILFSFHPSRALTTSGEEYSIFVGICVGHQTFFVMSKDDVL